MIGRPLTQHVRPFDCHLLSSLRAIAATWQRQVVLSVGVMAAVALALIVVCRIHRTGTGRGPEAVRGASMIKAFSPVE